ncbi:unnamed protein product [Trichobilharzia regenti]|nr:unnamed protein product [Trichobilharzia regenti]
MSNLPSNFAEADLLDLLTALCPSTVFTTNDASTDASFLNIPSSTSNSPSDNLVGYEIVYRLINFAVKQFKHASNRANQSCYTLESTNAELKKALDESKQQVNQLVETIDGIIADQRQSRETENNLNREIKVSFYSKDMPLCVCVCVCVCVCSTLYNDFSMLALEAS